MSNDRPWPARNRLLASGWRECLTATCKTVINPKHARGQYCGNCLAAIRRKHPANEGQ